MGLVWSGLPAASSACQVRSPYERPRRRLLCALVELRARMGGTPQIVLCALSVQSAGPLASTLGRDLTVLISSERIRATAAAPRQSPPADTGKEYGRRQRGTRPRRSTQARGTGWSFSPGRKWALSVLGATGKTLRMKCCNEPEGN